MDDDSQHRPLIPTAILLTVIIPALMTLLAWSIEVQLDKPVWAHTVTIVLVAAFWYSLGKRWLQKHGLNYAPTMGRWTSVYFFLAVPTAYGLVWLYNFAQAKPFDCNQQLIALSGPTFFFMILLFSE